MTEICLETVLLEMITGLSKRRIQHLIFTSAKSCNLGLLCYTVCVNVFCHNLQPSTAMNLFSYKSALMNTPFQSVACFLCFCQWDQIQELLGHPMEKPVVLHRYNIHICCIWTDIVIHNVILNVLFVAFKLHVFFFLAYLSIRGSSLTLSGVCVWQVLIGQ